MTNVEDFLRRFERPPCFGKYKRNNLNCRDCNSSDKFKCEQVSKNK
jgi:hypothetical protein